MDTSDYIKGKDVFHSATLNFNSPFTSNYSADRRNFIEDKSNRRHDWIGYGENNQWSQYLISLAKKSILHGGILRSKVGMIAGTGILCDGDEDGRAAEFFKKIGVDRLHREIAWDMAIFGGSAPQVIYGLDSSAKRTILRVYKPKFETVRLAKPSKDNFGNPVIRNHFYHEDWQRVRKDDLVRIPAWVKTEGSESRLDFKNVSYLIEHRTSLTCWYPIPDYQTESMIDAIILDTEILKFDLAEIKNGMNASYIVTFFRNPKKNDEEERELRAKEDKLVRETLTGAHNASRAIVVRRKPNDKSSPVDIQEVPNVNNEGRHSIIDKRKNIGILAAHGIVAPELAGIPDLTKGGFSSQSDQLLTANELIFENRIQTLQEPMIRFYQDLLDEVGIDCRVRIKNAVPVKSISDQLWQWAFGRDEFRRERGFESRSDEVRQEHESE